MGTAIRPEYANVTIDRDSATDPCSRVAASDRFMDMSTLTAQVSAHASDAYASWLLGRLHLRR